eukprot:TRINITY_DN10139_c0_g1_i2.p1 TRINITY_DN10139_c0_g1~~TRINITY_DN10139_c0_g1_i2.p1  ORF type:complete len:1165 (-),score=488.14 TRINITY_DN10139_c0_g1_i2:35-3529(-)
MAKQKKGFNWRARAQPGGEVDLTEAKKLEGKVEVVGTKTSSGAGYEGSNALVLPAQGNQFKRAGDLPLVGRILSKKQRKRLEKIVDQKKKKEGRADLLVALQSVQVDSLAGMESLASVQTKGVKRQLVESREELVLMQREGDVEGEVMKKRKKIKGLAKMAVKVEKRADVVGFDSDSSSEDDEDEDSDEIVKEDSDQENTEPIEETPCPPVDILIEPLIESPPSPTPIKPTDRDTEELPPLAPTSHKPDHLKYVQVNRSEEIELSRSKLPIIAEEQLIMETINSQGVVVLSGETGSGKTTQLPQFLYEAGYASDGKIIGVTEPRRIAATAMANRVAMELGLDSSIVSYQIRYEGNVTEDTKIKFMTDGVLLREVEKDFLLSRYSVIIIDEAHERSVFTDILIGLLSRIVPLRHKKGSPLKVIIMSATLRVSDFTENSRMFKIPPPVISVESRQFPVTVHFNKRTHEDFMGEAFRKVCKIHKQLPEGGILVFLTGQQEVNTMVRKLKDMFPGKGGMVEDTVDDETEMGKLLDKEKNSRKKAAKKQTLSVLPEIDLSNYNIQPLDDTDADVHGADDEDADLDILEEDEDSSNPSSLSAPLHVLPLYSLLSSERQSLIWSGAPPGSRLCVVATNVAETSLTIPGVKYVVDTGKVKVKHWDKVTGVTTFLVDWTSQAQANQRAGRAGRQGPGHCYRLYSSAVFTNDMKDFSMPEIMQRPVDDLLLQMKTMNIDKVVNFPFPTCPDMVQLRTAETRLQQLGALQSPPPNLPLKEMEKLKFCSSVTPLGRCISTFPLAPRFGKMLALAHQHNLLPLALTLVSALTVQEVLVERSLPGDVENEEKKLPGQIKRVRKEWAGQGNCLKLGDAMVLVQAVIAAERTGYCPEFCSSVGLRHKAMLEIRRLRKQLAGEVGRVLPGEKDLLQLDLQPPDQTQARLLQQLLLAGSPNMVARRVPMEEGGQKDGYRAGAMEEQVFIHQASIHKQASPTWVVYQELFETKDKVVMRGVTEIAPEWLPTFCPGLCNLGAPLSTPSPRYCSSTGRVMASFQGTFGPCAWPLPTTEQEMPSSLDKFKWFGRFLLEGSVAPSLAEFTSSMLSNPLVMVKSWSNLQKRTELLVKELAKESVDGGRHLGKVWEKSPTYLLQAYLSWLPEVLHQDITKLWPPRVLLS